MLDVDEVYNILNEQNILLAHRGALNGDLIDVIVQLIDSKLAYSQVRVRVKKKVVNILVECLQNSYHYTSKFHEDEEMNRLVESPFLILSQHNDAFFLFTGNFVTPDRLNYLKEKLDKITDLSEEELQAFYIQSLNKDTLPTSGGAGLGLVDILRRSHRNVNFDFKQIDEHYSLFTILIEIK